jgi:hypothetical protein
MPLTKVGLEGTGTVTVDGRDGIGIGDGDVAGCDSDEFA